MEKHAFEITNKGENVYVNFPIINTKLEEHYKIIKGKSKKFILTKQLLWHMNKINVIKSLSNNLHDYVPVFSEHIADR